jgi:molecular chaperone GrpE
LAEKLILGILQIKPATEGEEKINGSYQGLYRQMVDIFRGMGLEAVPTRGVPFDPELHDGVMKEETDQEEDGIILEEFRKGFTFAGKLLRPAMVKVAVNSSQTSADSASDISDSSLGEGDEKST